LFTVVLTYGLSDSSGLLHSPQFSGPLYYAGLGFYFQTESSRNHLHRFGLAQALSCFLLFGSYFSNTEEFGDG